LSSLQISEHPSYLEEELGVAVIANRAPYFHWTEQGVHNQASDHIARKIWRLGPMGKLIGLSNFKHTYEVDGTAQQRRKLFQRPDIASLEEEILIRQ